MSYPQVLLPQPTYRLLPPAAVPAGWLLRRVDPGVQFVAAADGRPILTDPAQLCDKPAHFGDFSVSLAGQFEAQHAGWILIATDDATKQLVRATWQPPTPVTPPTATQMAYAPAAEWDVLGLQLAAVHERWFTAAVYGQWQACVTHVPTCWNYWHYEVRFQNTQGQWLHQYKLHDPRVVASNRHYELLCKGLLQSFQEAGLAHPLATVGTPAPWPETLFDTAAPAQS